MNVTKRLALFVGLFLLGWPIPPIGTASLCGNAAFGATKPDGDALMKQAAALEAAGKYDDAGEMYDKASQAFEAAGQVDKQTLALKASAAAYEKMAASLETGAPATTPTPTAVPPKTAPKPAAPTAHTPLPPTPPDVAKPVSLPRQSPRAGYITGRAVTESGAPLPSFTVHYYGFADGKLASSAMNGGNYETVDSNVMGSGGRYAVKVPPGVYRAQAFVTYISRGKTYNFDLEPLNEPVHHDDEGHEMDRLKGGLVRDFVLRMTSKITGADESTETPYKWAYHGGRLDFDAETSVGAPGSHTDPMTVPVSGAYPRDSRIDVTLTPQGPMVDGTKGKVITASVKLSDHYTYMFCKRGIYPGPYTATATLTTPDGTSVPLRLTTKYRKYVPKGSADGYGMYVMDWQPSTTVDFQPNDLGPRPCMGVTPVTLYMGPPAK